MLRHKSTFNKILIATTLYTTSPHERYSAIMMRLFVMEHYEMLHNVE